ncbi:helix-turn-helix domain-containing protein [Actinomadura geliboluensis]|uniref:Helix-turn-helix domain-containing protein n=1 Tax=Actinomadura geliboluensis TaxID=882440 RepID=A0A5S4GCL1_9ACTN|nr:helix-turn-helix domain-containing protein [Actinomadura geliboluensis]TMR30713.1 helix-turn-helix domain-containing protein [Actinomadura geliboluensis]
MSVLVFASVLRRAHREAGRPPAPARVRPELRPCPGPAPDPDWLDDMRRLIATALPDGPVTVGWVANRMAVSSRTLQRRLHDAGTSWRDELECVRGRSARLLLEDGALTREAVARRLGYSDARSLRRALRRWEWRAGSAA